MLISRTASCLCTREGDCLVVMVLQDGCAVPDIDSSDGGGVSCRSN